MLNENENFAKIKVIGLGGAGSNAIDNMIEAGIQGVEFIACNTDLPHLSLSNAPVKLEIGENTTGGLGSGMDPEIGRKAAEESIEQISDVLDGADLVILALGEGGGTGTGSAPVFAHASKREKGILTIAVVTTPAYEGKKKKRIAEEGINALKEEVDAIIVVDSERVFQAALNEDENISNAAARRLCDEALMQNVQAISEVVSRNGAENIDMTDITKVIKDNGTLRVGIGEATGSDAAVKAVQQAISSPLWDSVIDGATHAIVVLFGSEESLNLKSRNQAAKMIEEIVDEDALIKHGIYYDDQYDDRIKVIVIAAGFDERANISGPNEAPRDTGSTPPLEIPDNIAELENSEQLVAQTPVSSGAFSAPASSPLSSSTSLFSSSATNPRATSTGSINSLTNLTSGIGSSISGNISALSNPSLEVPQIDEDPDDDLDDLAFLNR